MIHCDFSVLWVRSTEHKYSLFNKNTFFFFFSNRSSINACTLHKPFNEKNTYWSWGGSWLWDTHTPLSVIWVLWIWTWLPAAYQRFPQTPAHSCLRLCQTQRLLSVSQISFTSSETQDRALISNLTSCIPNLAPTESTNGKFCTKRQWKNQYRCSQRR